MSEPTQPVDPAADPTQPVDGLPPVEPAAEPAAPAEPRDKSDLVAEVMDRLNTPSYEAWGMTEAELQGLLDDLNTRLEA